MTDLSYSADQDTSKPSDDNPKFGGGRAVLVLRAVQDRIANGTLVADQRLPSIRAMAAELNVSRDTVQRAYDRLVSSGQIYARRGSGFYVSPPRTLPSPSSGNALQIDLGAFQLIHSSHPANRSPGSGALFHKPSEIEELNRVLKGVTAGGLRSSGYGDAAGYLPLREQLRAKVAADGIDVPVESIITTPGCVAGLGVVIRSLVRPGGTVLIEDPASFAHVASLLAQGANILRVPRLSDGPDIDVLRTLCERHRPVVFLVSSLIQNPTGRCISLHKARQLIEIAAEFDLTLIDDAFNADLLPLGSSRGLAPLMLLDNLDRVIHIGGSSRILGPQIGAGYIIAGERYIDMLRRFRLTHCLGSMQIQERVFFRFLDEGLFRRRCERIRAQLTEGAGALRQHFNAMGVEVTTPVGGPHLWVDCGERADSSAIAKLMSARGFLTAPGSYFRPPRMISSEFRFNVTSTSEESLSTFKEILGRS